MAKSQTFEILEKVHLTLSGISGDLFTVII